MVTTYFSEIIKFQPQFSFWISLTLTKIFFFPHMHKPRQNTFELVDTVLALNSSGLVMMTFSTVVQSSL